MQFSYKRPFREKVLLIKAPEIFESFTNIKVCVFFRRFNEEVKNAFSYGTKDDWPIYSRCWEIMILHQKMHLKEII